MHTRVKSSAISHFLSLATQEACGLIVVDPSLTPRFVPCTNVAEKPIEEFQIGKDDYLSAVRAGKVIGVCHSHIDSPTFSRADVDAANEYALPLYMYHIPTGKWDEFVPSTYHLPLEGREFCWGSTDCLGLIRDYYRAQGIYISDFDRDENSTNLGALVESSFAREGFVKRVGTTQFQRDDLLVFRTNGVPQHLAVFVGNSKVLHHPRGALSRIDQLNVAWRSRLHMILHYQGRV